MFFVRWEEKIAENYLLKTEMDVDYAAFERSIESRVKNRLDAYDEKI